MWIVSSRMWRSASAAFSLTNARALPSAASGLVTWATLRRPPSETLARPARLTIVSAMTSTPMKISRPASFQRSVNAARQRDARAGEDASPRFLDGRRANLSAAVRVRLRQAPGRAQRGHGRAPSSSTSPPIANPRVISRLLVLGAELGAERLVDRAQLVGVLGGERAAAGDLGDLPQRSGSGGTATGGAERVGVRERPVARAERDGVDRDLQLRLALRGDRRPGRGRSLAAPSESSTIADGGCLALPPWRTSVSSASCERVAGGGRAVGDLAVDRSRARASWSASGAWTASGASEKAIDADAHVARQLVDERVGGAARAAASRVGLDVGRRHRAASGR